MPIAFPDHVVVTQSRRPLIPMQVGEDPRKRPLEAWKPVGVRHAASTGAPTGSGRSALCGTPLAGWHVFLQHEFTGGNPADCRRCAQVLQTSRQGVPAERS